MANLRKLSRRGRLLGFALVGLMVFSAPSRAFESHYIPFDWTSAALLLQQTVNTKLIPYDVKGDGFKITITKLNRFTMDWEQSQFILGCSFSGQYQKGFISFSPTGEVEFVGTGLLAAPEQKLGVKLVRISGLRLDGTAGLVSEGARMILDKSLSGKEFWYGQTPAFSEVLTQNRLGDFLNIALSKNLPLSGDNEQGGVTLTDLRELSLLDEPGRMRARFGIKGTCLRINYEGEAAMDIRVAVDPDELAGKIQIDQLTELKLHNTPGLIGGIIKMIANTKLKGKEFSFCWK